MTNLIFGFILCVFVTDKSLFFIPVNCTSITEILINGKQITEGGEIYCKTIQIVCSREKERKRERKRMKNENGILPFGL